MAKSAQSTSLGNDFQAFSVEQAVENFRAYLRINTVQPTPDYEGAMQFLADQARSLQLEWRVITLVANKPIGLMTWRGQDSHLPSLLLNSHVDVVPVFAEHWRHDPFAAVMDDKGDIYARGAQDMKCVGSQYLEAVRRLRGEGYTPLRDVHISFVPDEEIGGKQGMGVFVDSAEYRALNVGCALDEGLANPTEEMDLYYGERCVWWVHVIANGQPGHGSQFLPDNAGQKLRVVIDRFMDFRASEERRLAADPSLRLGDVTTVNLTRLAGGVQHNVVPAELSAGFDVRLAPSVDHVEFEAMLNSWLAEAAAATGGTSADGSLRLEFLQKGKLVPCADVSSANPWWRAFSRSCVAQGVRLGSPVIFPAATDSRYIRDSGACAFGFSPMNHTPVLLHDHNEYLNKDVFIRGIEIYYHVLQAMIELKD